MALEPWIGPAIVAAVVAALLGIFRDGLSSTRHRRERTRDVQLALLAEINAHVAVLDRDHAEVSEDESVAQMEAAAVEGGAAFVPFIPSEQNAVVFDALAPELHALPEQTIERTVVYYAQIKAIEALIGDMQSERYRDMARPRQLAVYRDYIKLKLEARVMGKRAMTVMNAWLDAGDLGVRKAISEERVARAEANRAETRDWLSSRGGVPSDQ